MNILKRSLLCLLLLVSALHIAKAQDNLDLLLQNSVSDGKILLKGYLTPFVNSLSLSLNQGWYNTAKPHKPLGVDLTITVNAMLIPSSEMYYDISKLNLQEVELDPSSPNAPKAPTFFGPETQPLYRMKSNNSVTYNGPGGVDLKSQIGSNMLPVPMATLGIGLPKEIDIKLRFTPTINGGDGEFKLFGIGVMHNVKQYIPGLKLMPFDLSAFVGYTRMSVKYNYGGNTDPKGENQRGEFSVNATTTQAHK